MTDVLFVRLEKRDKALHLCHWAQRFFDAGERVLIRVQEDKQVRMLDSYLWTFSKDSFLPHGCVTTDEHSVPDEPIVVTASEQNVNNATRLLMGSPCAIEFMMQFQQIIDFAEMYDPDLAQQSRERFRVYREAGFAPRMA